MAVAAPPQMAIPGSYAVSGAGAPGDMGLQPDDALQSPNVTSGGAFSYSIPIQAPPGTHGMTPHIALTYSSGAGDGFVGLGWQISGLSEITRCPQTIAQDGYHGSVNFDGNDRYCIDGQRLILTTGSAYGASNSQYHTEIESFRKIVACGAQSGNGPACFDVWTKDGKHYQYGYTSNAYSGSSGAQVLSGDGSTVRVWALSQVTDPDGNWIAYTWDTITSGYHLTRIDYGGNSTQNTGRLSTIKFDYESRNDIVPTYQAGTLLQGGKLLEDITTWFNTTPVWTYTLHYNEANWANQTISPTWHNELNEIDLCDSSGVHCFAPTKFSWQGSSSSWNISPPTKQTFTQGGGVAPADFNNDGITDIFTYSSTCPSNGEVYFGATDGSFSNTSPWTEYAEFDYWQSGQKNFDGPACFYPYQGYQQYAPYLLDFDGNGWEDLLVPVWETIGNSNYLYDQILRNNQIKQLSQVNNDGYLLDASWLVGDFNGDGLSDLFGASMPTSAPFISDGAGHFTPSSLSIAPQSAAYFYTGDFDGSGCTGLLEQGGRTPLPPGYIYYFCQTPGSVNFAQVTNWAPTQINGTGPQIVFGDFNGDSKTDVLIISSNAATIYLGTGCTSTMSWCAPTISGFDAGHPVTGGSSWHNYAVVAGDWNGDGKTDVALIATLSTQADHTIYLSTGTDFVAGPTIPNSYSDSSAVAGDWNSDGASDLWLQHASTSEGDYEYTFSYAPELMTSIDNGIGKVTTIGYNRINSGAQSQWGPLYTNGTQTLGYPDFYTNGPFYVVTQISTSNGVGGTYSWNYSYQGFKKDLNGRGFTGFDSVTVTDEQTKLQKTTTYPYWAPLYGYVWSQTLTCCAGQQTQTTLSSITNSWNSVSTAGKLGETYWFTPLKQNWTSGTDLDGKSQWPSTTTTYTYDNQSYGNIYQRTFINQTDCIHSQCFTSQTTNYYNYYTAGGAWVVNLPQSTSTENTPPTGSQYAITRTANFQEGTNQTQPWQLSTAVVQPGATDTTNLTVNFQYDGFGNETSQQFQGSAIQSRTTSVTYGTYGRFPIQTTNALNQSEEWSVEPYPGTSQGSTLTDLNGKNIVWYTDTLGHPASMQRVDKSQVTVNQYYCSGVYLGNSPYTCPTYGAFVVVTQYLGPDGSSQNAPTTLVFYDSLGREMQHDTEAFDGNWYQVDTIYDLNGNVAQTSLPYEVSSLAKKQCPAPPASQCTSYSNYDQLGRVTTVTAPTDSVTYYQYDGLQTTVTRDYGEPDKETTTTLRNPEGLVESVTDAWGGTTAYSYDAFGNPVQIGTPAHANQIVNTFDSLGRKKTSTDLDMGYWQYGYDNLGELISQTSPIESTNAQTTTLGYDVLGRLLFRSEPDMYSSWQYDTASNGVGFIGTATCGPSQQQQSSTDACAGGNYSRTYTYDGHERPSGVTIQYGGQQASSSEQYDANTGLLSTVTGFSQFSFTYGYQNGYLSEISNGGTVYWQANQMDAMGHLLQETEGNQAATVTIQRSYYSQNGLIASIEAGTGSQSNNIANLSYGDETNWNSGWDAFGNLLNRTDTVQNYDENFCYDTLNRLAAYAVSDGGGGSCTSGTIEKSMSYDQSPNSDGNIATKSDLGGYQYGQNGAGPHAVTSVNTSASGGCTLSAGCMLEGVKKPNMYYDADGNMLCVTTKSQCDTYAARTYSYTSFDMAEMLQAGTTNSTITYTPEHSRGALSTSSGTLYYMDNPAAGVAEEMVIGSTTTWRSYLAPYGRIIAEMFTSNGTVTPAYFVEDHLLSTTALTGTNGFISEYDSYDAWGRRRDQSGSDLAETCGGIFFRPPSSTLRGYTGQEMMDSFCLENMNARIYDPALGRFLSADPVVGYPTLGQSFNRYSYVLNDPLTLTDPTGLAPGIYCGSDNDKKPCLWDGGSDDSNGYDYTPPIPDGCNTPDGSCPSGGPGESSDDQCLYAPGGCGGSFGGSGLSDGGFSSPGGGGAAGAGPATLASNTRSGTCPTGGGAAGAATAAGAVADAEAAAEAALADIAAPITAALGVLTLSGDTPDDQGSDAVPIYRAVGPSELMGIETTGQFGPPPSGFSQKQFWMNLDSAEWYGNFAVSRGWDPSATVVQTSVSQQTLSLGTQQPLDGHPAVSFPLSALPQVNADAAKNGIQIVSNCTGNKG